MLNSSMRNLLTEAFADFDLMESATITEADDEEKEYDGIQSFSYDNAGVDELNSFLDTYGADPDAEENEPVEVVDMEAEDENDIKQSYIGKVIVDCNTCHGNIYLNPDELTVNEDGESTFDGECPYCMSNSGFTVIGEVQPYEPGVDAEDMEDELEDGEDIDIDAMEEEPVEDELPEEEEEEFEESLQLEDYADSKSMDAVDGLKGEKSLHRRADNIKEDDAINGESENAKKIVGTKTYKENYDETVPQTEVASDDAPVSPDFPMGKEEPVEQTEKGGEPKLESVVNEARQSDYGHTRGKSDIYDKFTDKVEYEVSSNVDGKICKCIDLADAKATIKEMQAEDRKDPERKGKVKYSYKKLDENLSEKRGIPQTAGRGTPKVSKDAPKGKAKSVPQTERGGKAMAEAVTLDTMDDVTVTQTPDGGVSVTSEPAEAMMDNMAEIEMIAPISDEVEAELPPEALPIEDEEPMMDEMPMEEPPMDEEPIEDFDEEDWAEIMGKNTD